MVHNTEPPYVPGVKTLVQARSVVFQQSTLTEPNENCERGTYLSSPPRGSYIVYPLLSLELGTPENKSIRWTPSSSKWDASLLQKRFLVGCSSLFVQLAQHLTEIRAWCKQCLPGQW